MKRTLATLLALGVLTLPATAARTDLIMGMVLEPPMLDPTAGAAAAIDEVVFVNVFEGLTQVASDGSVKPALAESWTISDDGLTYTFTLKSGVKFHDGADFTSEDVIFSFDRARGEDSVNAQKQKFEPIDAMRAIDDTTLEITLKRPTGSFLFDMGTGDAVIVDPASADTNQANPVGTGPFKFSDWVQGDRVELVRNDDYVGDAVALEKATFKFIPDPAAAIAAMMAGDVDAFYNFPAPESMPQFEADPRFSVVIGSTEGETILSTNNAKPPFDNLKVRQAIAHALDRQAVIDGAMFGLGTPIGTHFAPHHPAYVDLINTYPKDLDQAKALLSEAGFPEGFSATIKLPPPTYARRGGEIIASELKKIGIELEIIPLEWPQWLEQVFRGKDYDLTIVSHTEAMDIGIYARDDYYFNYDNPELKAIIAELTETADTDARYELMRQAQQIITDDAVNGYIFQLAKAGVWNAKLEGLWANAPVQVNDLTDVRWVE
ncbi:MAG: ABC transporter substrate-binding protein [Pseudomonadota bacterium]